MKFEGADFTVGDFPLQAVTSQILLLCARRINSTPRDVTKGPYVFHPELAIQRICWALGTMKSWGLFFKISGDSRQQTQNIKLGIAIRSAESSMIV